MSDIPVHDFFTKEMAEGYDERNKKLNPISDCLHFLTGLVLKKLPEDAKVLCVGVGTGAEILYFSKAYPKWTFVGVDPSASMLEVCKERLTRAGVLDRCTLIHGHTQDIPTEKDFEAALSMLVTHFVKKEEKLNFFRAITERLKKGGYLINAEISFDLNSPEFPIILKHWEEVQVLMGATPQSLANLPHVLRDVLSVSPQLETEGLLQQAGILRPVRFFQASLITGWYGTK